MSSHSVGMTAVYKRCPFCERVFDLTADETGLRRHVRLEHTESENGGGKRENEPSRRTAG